MNKVFEIILKIGAAVSFSLLFWYMAENGLGYDKTILFGISLIYTYIVIKKR